MSRRLFYRNVRARDNFELFLVSAIAALLILRFILFKAGYPQVGGGSLHIAHMLYGGLLMVIAIALDTAFLGEKIKRLSAFVGGIGFGIFIDELGKFLTKDNNYFFRPTVGIIYAIFMLLYLGFSFISRDQQLTSREYQLNALMQLQEAIEQDLDPIEKHRIRKLLKQADQKDELSRGLLALVDKLDTVAAPAPNRVQRVLSKADKLYVRFWRQRRTQQLVGILFIVEALLFVIIIFATSFSSLDSIRRAFHGDITYGKDLLFGQLVSSGLAAVITIIGAIKLPASRLQAFGYFKRAVLVNLFLTEFFVFSRVQFHAIPGLIVNLVLIAGLNYAIFQERRQLK
jgi:hypothetical protein